MSFRSDLDITDDRMMSRMSFIAFIKYFLKDIADIQATDVYMLVSRRLHQLLGMFQQSQARN